MVISQPVFDVLYLQHWALVLPFFLQDFPLVGHHRMFYNMTYNFLTFQLIFHILDTLKVVMLLDLVLETFLCLYELSWRLHVILSAHELN